MDQRTDYSNVPVSIEGKIGQNLHLNKSHPICIIKEMIYAYFDSIPGRAFEKHDEFSPFVNIHDNFTKLRIEIGKHVSTSKSDTYYVNEETVLRTHTSAHQNELFSKGTENFLVTGDVYRKDEVDKSHYPVFHQMEGAGLVVGDNPVKELQMILSGLVEHLFPGCEYRYGDDYFPFTEPSFEIEVKYNDDWLEILGCGITHKEILDQHNITKQYWAFGLGLERLCMLFFKIPDIRYFWSRDEKFLSQFKEGQITEFIPYSNCNPITKDMSFWISNKDVTIISDKKFTWNKLNEFFEFVREFSDDTLESVKLFDSFYKKKDDKYSIAFHFVFAPTHTVKDPGLFNAEVDKFVLELRDKVSKNYNVELR